jgi:hypothetical protein
VHCEVLLADAVQRRYQRDDQRRKADDEQAASTAIGGIGVLAPSEAAIPDQVREPDPDQRDEQQRIGLKLRERRG